MHYAWNAHELQDFNRGTICGQGGLPMAAMRGPGGPSVAATLSPGGPIMGDHRWHDSSPLYSYVVILYLP